MTGVILLVTGGLLAGTIGGMLGIGGGIILMPLLRFVVGLSPAYAAGTCVLAVFFTTFGGSYRHYRLGHVNLKSLIHIIIAGAIGTTLFSLLFEYLATRERWLDLGLGLVFSLIAARMIFEALAKKLDAPDEKGEEESGKNVIRGPLFQKATLGLSAGILPGLLGIGTGGILVPSFTFIFGAPIKVAMASSLTCFSVNAFISSYFKLVQGFIDLGVALPICLGTLVGANLGATLNRRFSSSIVSLMFGLIFCYVSLKFILRFFEVRV